MPSFCRHNRLLQNCPICTREQSIEGRPIVSSSAPAASRDRAAARPPGRSVGNQVKSRGRAAGRALKVRRLDRGSEDGHRSELASGLRSSIEAERLALELSFSAARLTSLSSLGSQGLVGSVGSVGSHPPSLLAQVADREGDLEERTWLAFLVAYLSPLDGEDPFRSISAAHTSWRSGEPPRLDGAELGPRTAHDPGRGPRTAEAYRAWAARSGSQAVAFTGDPSWSGERRFSRMYERLALPGLSRDARYELLVLVGRLGLYDCVPATLALGGDNPVTIAAKRAFGIGDPLLLERRALALAEACDLPLEALDLALFNWERGTRADGGVKVGEGDLDALGQARAALGLPVRRTGPDDVTEDSAGNGTQDGAQTESG